MVRQLTGVGAARPVAPPRAGRSSGPGTDFRSVLRETLGGSEPLRFSAHAQDRMVQRDLVLGPAEGTRLAGAVDRAAAKGAREALFLMEDKAFIVAVESRTVITALDRNDLKERVVTGIDCTVIVE